MTLIECMHSFSRPESNSDSLVVNTEHVGSGRSGGPRRRGPAAGHGEAGDGRRPGGPSVAVPGEAEDEALLQEDPVRGAQAQRREAAKDERPLRQACHRRWQQPRHRWPRLMPPACCMFLVVPAWSCETAGRALVRRHEMMT